MISVDQLRVLFSTKEGVGLLGVGLGELLLIFISISQLPS